MTKSGKLAKEMPVASRFDDMFKEFRREMATMSSCPDPGLFGYTHVQPRKVQVK